MKKLIIILSFFVAVFNLFAPLGAFAQSSREGDTPWRGREREEIRSWRGRSSAISTKINKLDDDRVDELPVPILLGLTPVNLTRNFGDPRVGHTHEGLDIMAPRGALIASPTEAVVIRVGTGESSGNYVYTANPGGETFAYMHLDKMSELEEGDELEKGDFIGYVGNTGNAAGGPTHLHFEIRHDGDATDPFPRLKRIFTLQEKMDSLENILDDAGDEKELAELMVKMYRSEFIMAKTYSVGVPEDIEDALASVPLSASISSSGSTANSNGTLRLGSSGTAVTTLQKFLLSKNIGYASHIVADGSFGPITQQALMDYQFAKGLKPVDGIYGPATRAYISSHP